ncbi:MAG TPA: hypothetical protein RMH99_20370 [Sandaracinaceae bacterium LLY-WYZ-13_1]|nr:hypothetical protein [Sandaracinaceae bacterium LLY-WYZ-13_1]
MAQPSQPEKKPSKSTHLLWIIPLAIVGGICLIGILAAVAIPAFLGYLKESKTVEARQNVRTLALTVQEHCERTGALPGSAGPIPQSIPSSEAVIASFGTDPVFGELGFGPSGRLRYSYLIVPRGTEVHLRAVGDLDGDGVTSTYQITCRPDCSCDDELTIENELE